VNRSRLIVLEGVAGSGKSTLARFVGDLLAARGAPHRVVLEGDLDHPADYESIAWLPEPAFADLLDRHPWTPARSRTSPWISTAGSSSRTANCGPKAS